jgi:dihydrolipoamide dehydrogenase
VKSKDVDVAIIGAGSAGLYALGKVRASGKSFVLIDGGTLGTTCARVGCMPSKAFIQVAEEYHRRHTMDRYGITGRTDLKLDTGEAMEHVRELRDTFVERVLAHSTDQMDKQHLLRGNARFLEPHLLEVDGKKIRAEHIIIATGSRPLIPAAWNAFRDRILTTDELFEQEELPESMAVIGLGAIGLELGQSLARLGVEVTGFDLLDSIGGLTDPEVTKSAISTLSREFPMHLGKAAEITPEGEGLRVTAGEHSVVVKKVLASLGRIPNLEGLNLEQAGIERSPRGIPLYDPHTMQCGDSHIFIAGDVNGDRPLLHEAGDEGRIAGWNATQDQISAFQRKTPLGIVFCDPNICLTGARWSQLNPKTTAVGAVQFPPVGRALIMGKNKGMLRVYADQASGRLLGAEMFCVRAEHLGHLLSWCIQQGLTVGELLRMPFYHPVIEEALQAALYDCYAKVETKNDGPITELKPMLTPR